MTNDVFLKGMAMIIACFKLSPDETSLKLFEMLLDDLSDSEFMEAVINLCRSSPKFPGDNLAGVIRSQVEKQESLSPEEAWGEVQKEMRRTGSWGIPEFSSEAIKRTINAMGWRTICLTEQDQMGILRAHFFKVYHAYCSRIGIENTRDQLIDPKIREIISTIGNIPRKLKE